MPSSRPLGAAALAALALLVPPSLTAQQRRPTRARNARAATADTARADSAARPSGDYALRGLQWRLVGPFRGGRAVAVTGDPVDRFTFYFGGVDGGVWRSTNGGASWANLTDGKSTIASVGAIAIAPSDPNVIWVGTGEADWREDLTHGNGVWRSTDGGDTWQHLGLEDTRHIAALRVDPTNPDVAWVAAMGHAFGPNAMRGVFRTRDGGKTWQKVLYLDENTGAIDLALDPSNPRILFAAMWRARRYPWKLDAGAGKSGLWRSTDGGDTWTEMTRAPGMPKGPMGRIGVAISPANPNRIWANIEQPPEDSTGGIYRSDDGGRTWTGLNHDQKWMVRPWYYGGVTADPLDENTVWVLNLGTWRSVDGGKTFSRVRAPHGDDHTLWIDPKDSKRMIEGNDGGATASFDAGETWSSQETQPTAQFYHVATDDQFPYHLIGAQQDNTSIRIRSRSDDGTIGIRDYENTGGGESGYNAVRPDDPNIVFGASYMGTVTRWDARTKQARDVSPWQNNWDGLPVDSVPYRFAWTFPIVLSPHDPNRLYIGAQKVLETTNEGQSWTAISPDLTVHDPATMGPSGGPVTRDMTGTEFYATVFTFAESPVQAGLLWAGSDDGLLHLSRDGGKTWTDVTPPGLGKFPKMSIVEPSHCDAGTAYLAVNRYQQDDYHPYLFRTTDYGKTWTKIVAGIPDDDFTRSIREDPKRRGLLFAGTESGIWVSFDDGAHWQSLQLNLPHASVRDMTVHGADLLVATHGRAFWALDDISPLRQLADSVRRADVFLFAPEPALRWQGGQGRRVNAAPNPPDGAIFDYWLREKPAGKVSLAILDPRGATIRTYTSEEPAKRDTAAARRDSMAAALTRDTTRTAGRQPPTQLRPYDESEDSTSYAPGDSIVPARRGANRFVWDLHWPDVHKLEDIVVDEGTLRGPVAPPGSYRVRLTVNGKSYERAFAIVEDPRVKATPQELEAQFRLLSQVRDLIDTVSTTVESIQSMQRQLRDRADLAKGQPYVARIDSASKTIVPRLESVREQLAEVHSHADEITLHYPVRIYNQLLTLNAMLQSADAGPTQGELDSYQDLLQQVQRQQQRLMTIVSADVAQFNGMMQKLNVPAVTAPAAKAATIP